MTAGGVGDAPKEARPELEQATQRLDTVVKRTDDLENGLARLGARLEAIERRVEDLAAALAHARASVSPSAPAPGQVGGAPASPPPTPGPGGSAPTVEELYQSGMAKYRAGEADAAVLIFYDLVTSYPNHPLRESAQFMVGEIYYGQKDLRGALAEFEDLLAAVPKGSKTADVLLKIGLCQRGLADAAGARRTWERLVREYPSSPAARQGRALLGGARRR